MPGSLGALKRQCERATPAQFRDMLLGTLRMYRIIDDAFRKAHPAAAKLYRTDVYPVSVALFSVEEGRD